MRLLRECCLSLLSLEYNGSQNEQLIRWAELSGHKEFSTVQAMLFAPNAKKHPAGCVELWCSLAKLWQADDKSAASLLAPLDSLLHKLATASPEDSQTRYPRYHDDKTLPKQVEWSPEGLLCFLQTVAQEPTAQRLPNLLEIIQENTKFFGVETIVLPALEKAY